MNENNNCVYQRANTTPERAAAGTARCKQWCRLQITGIAKASQTWQAHRLIDELAVVVVSEFRVMDFWVFLLGSYPTPHIGILVIEWLRVGFV